MVTKKGEMERENIPFNIKIINIFNIKYPLKYS